MTDAERPFRSLARPDDAGRPRPRLRRRPARAACAAPCSSQSPTPPRSPTEDPPCPHSSPTSSSATPAPPSPGTPRRSAPAPSATPTMDGDRIGHAELDVAGATALPGRRLPRARPDRTRATAGSRSPCTSRCPTSTPSWPGPRPPARRSSGRADRRPVRPHRRDRRPVRPPLDAADARRPRRRPAPRPGDVVYLTLQVPDGARARDFYGAVLGWTAVPGRVPDGWQVEGTDPDGRHRRRDHASRAPCRCTPSTTSRSRSPRCAPPAGEAGEIERQSYGLSALCRDDQGLPFWLGQLELRARPRPPRGSGRASDEAWPRAGRLQGRRGVGRLVAPVDAVAALGVAQLVDQQQVAAHVPAPVGHPADHVRADRRGEQLERRDQQQHPGGGQPVQPDRAADHHQQDAEHLRLGARRASATARRGSAPARRPRSGTGTRRPAGSRPRRRRAAAHRRASRSSAASGRPTSWPSPVRLQQHAADVAGDRDRADERQQRHHHQHRDDGRVARAAPRARPGSPR